MSQFPVEDSAGILEGVNYLLSGPAGLGQNFQGFSTYTPAYIRPTGREPFMLPIDTTLDPSWYVDLTITNIVPIDVDPGTGETRFIQVTFTATPGYTNPPFQYGDVLAISGVTDSGGEPYDYSSYTVLESTTTTVTFFTDDSYVWATYGGGGSVIRDEKTRISTDCNAYVTIYGPTERVFLSNQIQCDFTYDYSTASTFDVIVQLNRYRGYPTNQQALGNNQYIFYRDTIITQQTFSYTASAGKTDSFESIFTTAIDSPSFGYYRYICDVSFVRQTGDVTPGVFTAGLRSLTSQVIKE